MTSLVAGAALFGAFTFAYRALNQGRSKEAQKIQITGESASSKEIADIERIETIFLQVQIDLGNNEKIKLIFTNANETPRVFGHTFSQEAGILLPVPFFKNLSEDAIRFIFKHELAHIRQNHLFKIPFYSLVAGLAPLGMGYLFSIHPTIALTSSALSTLATIVFYTRATESEADDIALKSATLEEIEAVKKTIEEDRQGWLKTKSQYGTTHNWRYYLIDDKGNPIGIDPLHPSHSSREAIFENTFQTLIEKEKESIKIGDDL